MLVEKSRIYSRCVGFSSGLYLSNRYFGCFTSPLRLPHRDKRHLHGCLRPGCSYPNLDSISEFRIIMDNFSAEYGHFNAGQVKYRF